jgi:hypothetical protein
VAARLANPLPPELLERLEQAADLTGRDHLTGVPHREDGLPGGGAGGDLHPPAGHVVPQGVVGQVGDQALDQARVAQDRGRAQRGLHADAALAGFLITGRGDVTGDGGEIGGLRLLDAPFAAGQREQRADEPFLLLAEGQRLLAGRPQRLRGRGRVGHGHLEQGPLRGERGAQFVRGAGHELPLRRERGLEPAEQVVEGPGEFGELVAAAARAQPAVQVAGRDLPGGGRDRAHRPKQPAGHQPTQGQREQHRDRQGEHGAGDLVVHVGALLRRRGPAARRFRADRAPVAQERDREQDDRRAAEQRGVDQGQLGPQRAAGPDPARPGSRHQASPRR